MNAPPLFCPAGVVSCLQNKSVSEHALRDEYRMRLLRQLENRPLTSEQHHTVHMNCDLIMRLPSSVLPPITLPLLTRVTTIYPFYTPRIAYDVERAEHVACAPAPPVSEVPVPECSMS